MEHPSDAPCSDRSLLRRLRGGETDAATLLYLRYAERLGSLASAQRGADLTSRLDAEDLVQSIFRTFFRRAAEGYYDVPEGEDLWKLLLVIALHKIRDACSFHRAAKRDVRATHAGDGFEQSVDGLTSRDETALIELRLVVEEILGELPSSQRSIVELRIEGFRVEEIAQKTGRSRRTVERALQDFRAQLGALMREAP
jgi:RNA polymerase sigma-70 factor (ECF subfamily)